MPRFTIDGNTDEARQALFEWAERSGASTTSYDFCQECVDLYGLDLGDVLLLDVVNEQTGKPLQPDNGEPAMFADQYALAGGADHPPYEEDDFYVCCCCCKVLTEEDNGW